MNPAAIKAVFSTESDSDLYLLLTIYDKNGQPLERICDGFTQRLENLTTADQVIYGIERQLPEENLEQFIFIPMTVTLPTEESAQAPSCQITLHDVTRYITPIIRSIDYSPKVKLELMLSSTPNQVEATFTGFYVTGVTYNANTVVFELNMIDYDREPFPQYRFSPAYFPGLF